jgi:hypothetical protein
MAKKTIRSKRPTPRVTQSEQERIDIRRALARGVKREREIQRLTRRLESLRLLSTSDLIAFARAVITDAGYELVPSPGELPADERDRITDTIDMSRDRDELAGAGR